MKAARRPAVLAACLLASACATPPAPRPAPQTVSAPDPSFATRLAATDAKLARLRGRRVWPSPADREEWDLNLSMAEQIRRSCEGVSAEQTHRAGEILSQLEGFVSRLDAADGTFRLGERMREAR